MKKFLREIKWFFQRIFIGYADCDLWDLGRFLSEKILPSLKAFRKMKKISYPYGLKGVKEWNEILDKMIFIIEESANNFPSEDSCFKNNKLNIKKYENYQNKLRECQELFGKYFFNLWD